MMVGAQSDGKKDSYECIINFPYEFIPNISD